MKLKTKTTPLPLNFKALYMLALKWLTRREHSVLELRNKLCEKTDDAKLITEIIEQLLQKKYLDDTRFAESYARMRANKGCGLLRIKQELKQKGVIAENLNKNNQADIKQIFQKKFGSQKAKDKSELAKQIRFLQYKGFSFEEIKKVIKHDEV